MAPQWAESTESRSNDAAERGLNIEDWAGSGGEMQPQKRSTNSQRALGKSH